MQNRYSLERRENRLDFKDSDERLQNFEALKRTSHFAGLGRV